jgi:hypothetical protein
LIAIAAVSAFVAGCSKQNGGEFQEYVDDSPKHPAVPGVSKEANGTPGATVSKSADADRDAFAKSLPAALGFSSQVILSDTFKLSAEQWLPPAVGPAAAIALLTRVNSAVASNGKTQFTKRAGEKKPAAPPRKVQVLVKSKDFRTEGPDGAVRVSYDDIDLLRVINMDPVTPDAPKHMPDWLKDLHGKRIRIRGFMSPAFKQTGLEGFLMGRDNKACCFPGRAKIYDLFPVRLKKGHTTDYIQNRPFDVVGTFQIKPWIEDGELLRLYQIVDAEVVQ